MARRIYIRIASFILLMLFSFNYIGFWFSFKAEQSGIKKEMEEIASQNISEKNLTVVTISPEKENELSWIDEHEFAYQDGMYDVVKIKTDRNGTRHYYCINDKKEKQLFIILEEHVINHVAETSKPGKPTKNIFKNFIKEYLPLQQKIVAICYFNFFTFSFQYAELHSSFPAKISTPPPKQV